MAMHHGVFSFAFLLLFIVSVAVLRRCFWVALLYIVPGFTK